MVISENVVPFFECWFPSTILVEVALTRNRHMNPVSICTGGKPNMFMSLGSSIITSIIICSQYTAQNLSGITKQRIFCAWKCRFTHVQITISEHNWFCCYIKKISIEMALNDYFFTSSMLLLAHIYMSAWTNLGMPVLMWGMKNAEYQHWN